jgi:hypothetical protein
MRINFDSLDENLKDLLQIMDKLLSHCQKKSVSKAETLFNNCCAINKKILPAKVLFATHGIYRSF